MIGKRVRANDCSDYEGLVGEVVDVRVREEDKDTDNEGVDIYVSFEIPSEELTKEIEERFSVLYGEQKTINDLALDLVIMGEDMLEFLD